MIIIIPSLLLFIILIVFSIAKNKDRTFLLIPKSMIFISLCQALVVAFFITWLSWKLLLLSPEKYSGFITGSIGFFNQNKSAELYALSIGVSSLILFSGLFVWCFYYLKKHHPTDNNDIFELAILSLIPAILLIAQSLRNSSTTALLFISFFSIFIFFMALMIWILIKKRNELLQIKAKTFLSKVMLSIVFTVFTVIGCSTILYRIEILYEVIRTVPSFFIYGLLTIFCLTIYLATNSLINKNNNIEKKLNLVFFLSQLGIPLLVSILLSPLVIRQGGEITSFKYNAPLFVLIGLVAIMCYLNIIRQYLKKDSHIGLSITPWILVIILIYFHGAPLNWPGIDADDYHQGELFLPWWQLFNFNYIPYIDYQPTRGLMNYFPGLLSWVFYDNTYSGINLVGNLYNAFFIFIPFFGFRLLVDDLTAFLITFSLHLYYVSPTSGMVLAVVSLALLLFCVKKRGTYISLWVWLILSICILLVSISDGSVYVLGTIPFVLWLLYLEFTKSKKRLLYTIGGILISTLAVIIFTNIDSVIFSAIRYLFEQASINSLAHGVAWQLPTEDISNFVTSGYFWQIIRFSWLLLLLPIIYKLFSLSFKKQYVFEYLFLFSLLFMSILIIPRAAGRIDPTAVSRPGLVSVGLVISSLPLILNLGRKNLIQKPYLFLVIALVFGLLGNQEVTLRNSWDLHKQLMVQPSNTIDGDETGLANLGDDILMDGNGIKRQKEIKIVLDRILQKNETYYDLTNHNADYGFQNRPSPVADTAVYNLPSESQQIRTVEQLQTKDIFLVLISGENISHDGGTLPLRNHVIYEYILDHFLPFKDEFGRIWAIRSDTINRLLKTKYVIDKNAIIPLYNEVFLLNQLQELPISWGNSERSLQKDIRETFDILKDENIVGLNSVKKINLNTYEVVGNDPHMVFQIPENKKGEFIYLEINEPIAGGTIQVFWSNDLISKFNEENSMSFPSDSTKYFIPLYSAPSWELASNSIKIRIDLPEGKRELIINFLKLFNRITGEVNLP